MCRLFVLLILFYFNIRIHSHDLEVMNSGVMKLDQDDMMLVLFVTIHHHGDKALNVLTRMVECCEKITDDDNDCNVIQVYGEYLDLIQPGSTLNITFLYPNIYGYNRRAYCDINIWNRKGDGAESPSEIRHRICFDTTLRTGNEEIPVFLQGFYRPDKTIRCKTIDLDPFDGCNPVDCRIKYSGLRNYYDHKRKRCQKTPKCKGDPNKELPDIVYIPTSNTCKNLDNAVSRHDIQDLMSSKYTTKSDDLEGSSVNIQCHHGEIDVRTGLCICDKGWTSEKFDPEEYSQANAVYHMCDKKCHPDEPPSREKISFIIGLFVALLVFLLVFICETCNYFCRFFCKAQIEEEEVSYYPVSDEPKPAAEYQDFNASTQQPKDSSCVNQPFGGAPTGYEHSHGGVFYQRQ